MTDVNAKIREQVKQYMQEKGVTQQAAADQMGVRRGYINRMLNTPMSQLPQRWVELLDLLDLELEIKPKS